MFDDWAYRDTYSDTTVNAHTNGSHGQSQGNPISSDNSNGRRPRARSLLQQVALEKGIQSTGQSEKFGGLGDPPKADTELRRAQSFSSGKESSDDSFVSISLTGNNYLLSYPLSSKELVQQQTSVDQWLDEADPFTDIVQIDRGSAAHVTRFLENVSMSSYNLDKLIDQSSGVLKFLDELHSGFNYVGEITDSLLKASQDVQSEQKRLSKLAQEISSNLEVFTNLNKATRMLNAPGDGIVMRQSFAALLKDLDRGLDYVSRQKNVKDIDLYQMRYQQCMTRAMTLVHDYVCSTIKTSGDVIDKQLTDSISSVTLNALLYDKFGNNSDKVQQVSSYLADRTSHNEYNNLYENCIRTYLDTRRKLLVPVIDRDLADLSKDPRNLLQTTRSSLKQFKEICLREQTLFAKFFKQNNTEVQLFENWLEDLSEPLYVALRQKIIREQDIEGLCEITALLLADYSQSQDNMESNSRANSSVNINQDTSQKQIDSTTGPTTDFSVFFKPILHDVQSRLVFRVRTQVQNDITRYTPKAEDLKVAHRRKHSPSSTTDSQSHDELNDAAMSDIATLLDGWYPPLSTAITLLSQIYQLVNSAVFDDLAHQIVHECIESLEKLQALAYSRLGHMETWLFMIKNYLMLRAQIIEFDIDQLPTQVQVDFSEIQQVLRSLRNEGINSNSLLKLAKATVPKVVNNMFDAKEELYAKLKNAIHNFTETAVREIVKDITVTDGAQAKPLLPKAQESTRAFRQAAAVELPRIRELIATYIEDPKTVDILIDSIQDLVIQAYHNFMLKLREEKPTADQLDALMDTDGIVSWLGDIVAKLHIYDSEADSSASQSPRPED